MAVLKLPAITQKKYKLVGFRGSGRTRGKRSCSERQTMTWGRTDDNRQEPRAAVSHRFWRAEEQNWGNNTAHGKKTWQWQVHPSPSHARQWHPFFRDRINIEVFVANSCLWCREAMTMFPLFSIHWSLFVAPKADLAPSLAFCCFALESRSCSNTIKAAWWGESGWLSPIRVALLLVESFWQFGYSFVWGVNVCVCVWREGGGGSSQTVGTASSETNGLLSRTAVVFLFLSFGSSLQTL